jgi:uncharacterized protein (TIGR03435 family)
LAVGLVATVLGSSLLTGVDADAQANSAVGPLPTFEVASVKPSATDRGEAATARSWGDVTDRVTLVHIPLKYLLLRVYDLQADQLSGPAWLDSEYFDIFAVVPAGAPKRQVPLMFQALLLERFHLKFHRDTRVAEVYALVAGDGGAKLKESVPDNTEVPSTAKLAGSGENTVISGSGTEGAFGRSTLTLAHGNVHTEFQSITMSKLAQFLSQGGKFDLPVVDMTGLRGSYDVPLDYPLSDVSRSTWGRSVDQADPEQAVPSASDPPGVSLRGSLLKLGLKLDRRKLANEKFVIDHIDRTPTPN